jgi:hypothetical protein
VPLATLGTDIEATLSRDISGSPGISSIAAACSEPAQAGKGSCGRSAPAQRPDRRTSSDSVISRGPAHSNVRPAVAGSLSAATSAAATSCTHTGWKRAEPKASGMNGASCCS